MSAWGDCSICRRSGWLRADGTCEACKVPPTGGAALVALRKREERACEGCGKVVPMLAIQRYCDDACRQRSDYRRSRT